MIAVVPLVGAWIETLWRYQFEQHSESFPSWERGLKRIVIIAIS